MNIEKVETCVQPAPSSGHSTISPGSPSCLFQSAPLNLSLTTHSGTTLLISENMEAICLFCTLHKLKDTYFLVCRVFH